MRRFQNRSPLLHNAIQKIAEKEDFWTWLVEDHDEFIETRQFNQNLTLLWGKINQRFFWRHEDWMASFLPRMEVVSQHVDFFNARVIQVTFRTEATWQYDDEEETRWYAATYFWNRLPFSIKYQLFLNYMDQRPYGF